MPALPFTYDGTGASLSPPQQALGARYFLLVDERADNAPDAHFTALPQPWFPALRFVHIHGSTAGGHDGLRELTLAFDERGAGRIVASVEEVDESGAVEVLHGLRLCADDEWTRCEDVTAQLVTALRAELSATSPDAFVSGILRVMVPILGASGEGRVVRTAADFPGGEMHWFVSPPPVPAPPTFLEGPDGIHAKGLVVAPRTLGGATVYSFALELEGSLSLTLRVVGQRVVYIE